MNRNRIYKFLILSFFFSSISCVGKNPNKEIEQIIDTRQLSKNETDVKDGNFAHTVYVPIYSEIYSRNKDTKVLLTATLSIRNTSEKDTLFLGRVNYYDTEGSLVRQYLEKSIYLRPLETVDYVIDEKDDIGGSGANFVIDWYASKPMKPLFQAVMLGTISNQGFSFTTDGVIVE